MKKNQKVDKKKNEELNKQTTQETIIPRVDADNRIDIDKLPKDEKGSAVVFDIKNEKAVNFKELALAEDELYELKKEEGYKDPLWVRLGNRYYDYKENRKKHLVSRKLYIILSLVTGLFGIHRFYEKRFIIGAIYLTCSVLGFTIVPGLYGFSVMMAFIDMLVALPMKPDENGKILI